MTRPFALTLAVAVLAGCALARGPQTLAERTADTRQRLDAAPTPAARRTAALGLLARTGLSPIAGLRPETGARYAAGRLVGGFVPGRRAGRRDTLVVVAAALDGPHAATLVEAARLLTERADTRGDWPERSILVALWDPGLSPEEGLAAVRTFPLWPRDAVLSIIVVANDADSGTLDASLGDADVRFNVGAAPDERVIALVVDNLYLATVSF